MRNTGERNSGRKLPALTPGRTPRQPRSAEREIAEEGRVIGVSVWDGRTGLLDYETLTEQLGGRSEAEPAKRMAAVGRGQQEA